VREEVWRRKLDLAQRGAVFLRQKVQTVRAIAVTGSVAYGDVKEGDDLDFLIICRRGTVYTTRWWCYFWAIVMGKLRREGREKDKWCLNMFLDEGALVLPESKRTCFSAGQLGRLRKVVDEGGLIEKMRQKNLFWTKDFQINAGKVRQLPMEIEVKLRGKKYRRKGKGGIRETLLRESQIWLMKKKITREVINEKQIFFHPLERGEWRE
jgi:hypothetical protein